jgi:5-methylthioadenosine/S-adenosylhomocysteine deaminase
MCQICIERVSNGQRALAPPPAQLDSHRRSLLRASVLAAGAATVMPASAQGRGASAPPPQYSTLPTEVGKAGHRTLIRGGAVMSMDSKVGNFVQGDVLIEGARILAVGPNLSAAGATVIEAAGMIVMPGFIDTHHHQFETALRGQLADSVLIPDGKSAGINNYFETVLQKFAPLYRPHDVYINELFASLSQIDAGVTTVMDVSQVNHTPEHSDAAIEALHAAGRRAVFGYFDGNGPNSKFPQDVRRIRQQWFSSSDQLLSMVMGGEIHAPGHEALWTLARELKLPIALHVVAAFGMQPTFNKLGASGAFGPDNIFIHMTGMTKQDWRYAADAGAHVSLSVPIEMQMRHGTPATQMALDHGMQPSLSTDVECTMTADMFTQMRSAMTLQRMFANELTLAGRASASLLTCADAIRFATMEGARGLKLDAKTGSLTPGKEADIILLDATALNVAPLNHVPGAVVTLMERSNVDTVMVAGKIRKWQGVVVGHDVPKLRRELEASRDYLFNTANVRADLFRA